MLNNAISETFVDSVHIGGGNLPQAYKGDGVVVGIIDGGFDFTHPMFKTDDGTTLRISKVWDQMGTGTIPNGYTYGAEYSGETDILNQQHDANTEESHGSHVGGIAGGSSFGNTNLTGVAPNSELVFVSMGEEESSVIDAISYIFNHATSQGKPAVINMSFGNMTGHFHDGNSLEDQAMGGLTNNGNILVASAANAQGGNHHLEYSFTNDTIQSEISYYGMETSESNMLHHWAENNSEVSIKYELFDNNSALLYSTSFYNTNTTSSNSESFTNGSDVISFYFESENSNPNNGFPNIMSACFIDANNPNNYKLNIVVTGNNSIHAWSEDAGFQTSSTGNYTNKIGDDNYTIAGAGANSDAVISVGSYNTKNSFTDLNGNTQNNGSTLNDLSEFSSLGPTTDGRTKPDICAPGSLLASAVNSFDNNIPTNFAQELINTTYTDGISTWYYGAFEGTSMSSPFCAGVIALMLEANPSLDVNSIRNILHNTARTDGFTGVIGNNGTNNWGWGKINALLAVEEALSTTDIEENKNSSNLALTIYPNPNKGLLNINTKTSNQINILSVTGRILFKSSINKGNNTIDISSFANGIYFITTTDGLTQKLIIQK